MFEIISEGFIYKTDQNGRTACGPRTALLKDGSIVCTYMTQTKIGSNDLVPMAAYSADGENWTEGSPIWPQYIGKKSSFVSVRPMPDGRTSLAGMWFNISHPGEMFWSDEASGMKENQLIWCFSQNGKSFPEPSVMELPYYASAEQPGGILVKESGEMLMIYAPYPTIEKRSKVITNQLVMLKSMDGGISFAPEILGSVDYEATFAESWITELGNGTLVAGSWLLDNKKCPDVYFTSINGGKSFKGPMPMGFFGQTTSLTPYGDDMLLVPYNQRKEGTIGVWLALAKPDEKSFNIITNVPAWEAELPTRSNTSGDFSQWTDYSFGEPQVTVMPDGTLLLVLWCDQPAGRGIRYVRLKLELKG